MFSVLLIAVVVLGAIFFGGLAVRLEHRLIRAIFALIGWPLRGLLKDAGVLSRRDDRFRK